MTPRTAKKRGRKAAVGSPLLTDFTRGFVASGLLSTLQDRSAHPQVPLDTRRALRHALQGGLALAAGSAAARALDTRALPRAVLAVAGGAAAVLGVEHLLRAPAPTLIEEN